MKHLVQATAIYKNGHQILRVPTSIMARCVIRVERVPEEMPQFLDGMVTIVHLLDQSQLYVTEDHVAVAEAVDAALQEGSQ